MTVPQTLTILAVFSFMITLVAMGNPLWLVGLITLGMLALVMGLPFTRLSLRFPIGGFPAEETS